MQPPGAPMGGVPVRLAAGLDRAVAWRRREHTVAVVAWRLALGWRTRRAGATWALALPLLVVERRDGVERRLPVPHFTLTALVAATVASTALIVRGVSRQSNAASRPHVRK